MWLKYSEPPFVLPPKHAAVFRDSAASLSDAVGWEEWEADSLEGETPVFGTLSQGQRQVAIFIAAKALLDPNVEPPKVTAVLAATVYAIYRELLLNIETEIESADATTLRQMVLEALKEWNYWEDVDSGLETDDEPASPPSADSDDQEQWSELVDALSEVILEDVDFEMDTDFLDMPPDEVAALKRMMNIDPEYFVAVVEDPPPQRLRAIRSELRALLD